VRLSVSSNAQTGAILSPESNELHLASLLIYRELTFLISVITEGVGSCEQSKLKPEHEERGLPDWFMALVGVLKVTFATMLLIGIWIPWLVTPAALGLSVLMLGALAMHAKVHDPLKRSLPAATVLALCLFAAAVQVSTTAPDARSNQGATAAAASTP
jgi:uncharacterized membrane protein YphA (DoxX/SURF4 family)